MKLRIELDIDPSEFDLANELVATLRTLTEHVKINLNQNGRPPSGDQGRAPTPGPPPAATRKPPSLAPPPAQRTSPRPEPIPSPASRPASHSSTNGAQEAQPPPPFDYRAALQSYENALLANNGPLQMEIAERIVEALSAPLPPDNDTERFNTFLAAYEEALWKEREINSHVTLDLCFLMPQLPEAILEGLKKNVISKAMKHLMIKRPLNTQRTEFFPQAETFAAMIKLEYVLIPGAIQTIMQLLRKPETCSAAITMLGKTVELCAEQLKEKFGEDRSLATLRAALEEVKHPEVEYDKGYIATTMGWAPPETGPPEVPREEPAPRPAAPSSPPPAAPPAAAPTPAPSGGLPRLEPISIWEGYGAPVRAVALDEERQQVVSIAQDGTLSLHTFGGERLAKINVKQRIFVEMDYNPKTCVLVMAGMPMPSGAQAIPPCYATYQVGSGRLEPLGLASPPKETKSLNKLRFLAQGSPNFVGAEGRHDNRQIIAMYSSASVQDAPDNVLVPIKIFESDQAMITAISRVPSSEMAFLSAGRSGEVLVWQVTQNKPAATLLPPAAADGADGGNASVITCLEVLGHLVLAGTYGQGTNVWNLRNLKNGNDIGPAASIKLDEHAVTRLARFGGPQDRLVAVAASKSIHTLRLREDGSLQEKMPGQKASEKFYWDAKWSSAGGTLTLFAASAASTVDVYRAV